ncbi:MAG: PEP-CTERM sorting domain-containing protein [Phycisphaerae bacterium]
MRTSGLAVLAAVAALMLTAGVASAHDADLGTVYFDGTGEGVAITFDHEDGDPWKGWVFVNATNTSDVAWGDFHFEIVDIGQGDVSNVDWVVDSPYQPVTSMALDSAPVVDNVVVGATLDFEFYGDPVNPGNSASFQVYTDNTTDQVNFGVMFYPTPVPEPATLSVLALGGLAVALRRRSR